MIDAFVFAVALMYATVFGNMVAIVQRLYSRASRFHSEMNTIKEFLRFYKIPEELRRSIQTYVRQEWTFSEGVDVQKVNPLFDNLIQAYRWLAVIVLSIFVAFLGNTHF